MPIKAVCVPVPCAGYNNMMKDITTVVIGVALLAVVWIGWAQFERWRENTYGPAEKACTLEAKLCPDGSYVGRTGPNCEFAACPGAR